MLAYGRWDAHGGHANLSYMLPALWDLAKRSGIDFTTGTAEEIQQLFEVWGKETEYDKNIPQIAQSLKLDGQTPPDDELLDLLDSTGALDRIPFRSIWSGTAPHKAGPVFVLLNGGTANWMQRRIAELQLKMADGLDVIKVFALANDNRTITNPVEKANPVVAKFMAKFPEDGDPTEADALGLLIEDSDLEAEVEFLPYTGGLSDNVACFAEDHPQLRGSVFYTPGNGPATYILLAIRRAMRSVWPTFDVHRVQYYVSQDDIPLARTAEQAANPAEFQRPLTMLSSLARLAREITLLTTA